MTLHAKIASAVILLIACWSNSLFAAPKILTTIKPIHSLVSGLTKNVTEVDLLLDGIQSPHDFHLKPSDRRHIEEADFIIYAADEIENFISELKQATNNKQFITLSKIPNLTLLKARSTHAHQGHNHKHGAHDGHIWLSIENAKTILHHLADILANADPSHRDIYLKNRNRLVNRLNSLKTRIQLLTEDIADRPFIQFHDAFQYFEHEYSLNNSLFVTVSPEQKIGIKRIRYLKQQIRQKSIGCIFYEPPQPPKILDTLIENTPIKAFPLDPIGIELPKGEDLYFNLLDNVAQQLQVCFNTK